MEIVVKKKDIKKKSLTADDLRVLINTNLVFNSEYKELWAGSLVEVKEMADNSCYALYVKDNWIRPYLPFYIYTDDLSVHESRTSFLDTDTKFKVRQFLNVISTILTKNKEINGV